MRRRRRRRLAIAGLVPAFAGCALAPPSDPVSAPYQVEAAREIGIYNARHHLDLDVPPLLVASTPPLSYGQDHCFKHYARYYGCDLVVSAALVASRPGYALRDIVPHEVAHDICVLTVPGCTADDHGPAWRAIALELGLPASDPFIVRPDPVGAVIGRAAGP